MREFPPTFRNLRTNLRKTMKKYLFFLDIDETLIARGHLPEENIRAIEYARSLGHAVFINTGRSPDFIPKFLFEKIKFDGVAAGSGAYIKLSDNVILSDQIDGDQLVKNAKFIKGTGRQAVFEGVRGMAIINPKRKTDYEIIDDPEVFRERFELIGVEKIALDGKLSPIEMSYFSNYYTVLQQPTYAECSIPRHDKGSSVETVKRIYGGDAISVAIGDSINDLPMLSVADISVAMGNAPEGVKHICDMETDAAERAGVAEIIYKLTKEGCLNE